jgi:DNA-binding GntR family transcriptional regulator
VVSQLSREDIMDLFTIQAITAGELAARAASRLSDEELTELADLQQKLDEAATAGDDETVDKLNDQFHRLVNHAAKSTKIAWFHSVAVQYVPRRFFAWIEGWPDAAVHDHSSVLKALTERDPSASRQAMQEHVLHAGELLADHLWPEDPKAAQPAVAPADSTVTAKPSELAARAWTEAASGREV